jgi:predicted GNAT family acetyltransferase
MTDTGAARDDAAVTVVDAPDQRRFEVRVGDEVAGFAQYVRRAGRLIFVHTEVSDEWSGRGLATTLATGALDAARAEGASVVPLCPFIASFIEDHPDYQDLVDVEAYAALSDR